MTDLETLIAIRDRYAEVIEYLNAAINRVQLSEYSDPLPESVSLKPKKRGQLPKDNAAVLTTRGQLPKDVAAVLTTGAKTTTEIVESLLGDDSYAGRKKQSLYTSVFQALKKNGQFKQGADKRWTTTKATKK